MIVTAKAMSEYRQKLKAINEAAAKDMQDYIMGHGFQIDDDFIRYAHSLTTKYGEAAAELSCQFYDRLAEYWEQTKGKTVRKIAEAEPAEVATLEDVSKSLRASALSVQTAAPAIVARLVKRAAEDTTMGNAIRDGAEFAWIPAGDTCAFCITLASRGWQRASKKSLKNGHAEHIHTNCDCTYSIRFDSNSDVSGYDPETYLARYNTADGNSPTDKINSMRRINYAKNRDKIRAQKRAAYARRKELLNEAQD